MNKRFQFICIIFLLVLLTFALFASFDSRFSNFVYGQISDTLVIFVDNSGSMKCNIGEKNAPPTYQCIPQSPSTPIGAKSKMEIAKSQLITSLLTYVNKYDRVEIGRFKNNNNTRSNPSEFNNYGLNCDDKEYPSSETTDFHKKHSHKFVEAFHSYNTKDSNSIEVMRQFIDGTKAEEVVSSPLGYALRESFRKIAGNPGGSALLLVTDDESNCGEGVCDVIKYFEGKENFDSKTALLYDVDSASKPKIESYYKKCGFSVKIPSTDPAIPLPLPEPPRANFLILIIRSIIVLLIMVILLILAIRRDRSSSNVPQPGARGSTLLPCVGNLLSKFSNLVKKFIRSCFSLINLLLSVPKKAGFFVIDKFLWLAEKTTGLTGTIMANISEIARNWRNQLRGNPTPEKKQPPQEEAEEENNDRDVKDKRKK